MYTFFPSEGSATYLLRRSLVFGQFSLGFLLFAQFAPFLGCLFVFQFLFEFAFSLRFLLVVAFLIATLSIVGHNSTLSVLDLTFCADCFLRSDVPDTNIQSNDFPL